MRILFIANSAELYGANRSMIDLAIGLKQLNQKVFFFIPFNGAISESHRIVRKKIERYGFTCVLINYSSSVHSNCGCEENILEGMFHKVINQRCLPKMQEWAERWKIDIIHTNSLTHVIGALLAKRINKPHVWHIRETLEQDYNLYYDNKFLYRYYLKRTEQIICISNYVKSIHKQMLSGLSVQVLYDGFNVDDYIIDNGYKSNKSFFTIIICGIIYEGKGQLEAVKAVECLIHNYKIKNIHMQIVGNYVGEYGNKIMDFIKKNNLSDYIEMIPFQEDLRELRKKADIALVCSKSEALGRVTIESMLSENLVIGANSGGTAEIIEEGVTGYLYKLGDIEDLSKKIYSVINQWQEQDRIINNAKDYAKKNFELNNYAKKVLKIYRKIM